LSATSAARAYATARLRIEPMVLADAQALFVVLSDLALYRYMAGPPPCTVADLARTIARREAHNAIPEVEPSLNWAIWLPSGQPVGHVQATLAAGEAWVGYALASSHWGLGYATEALHGLVARLREVSGIERCLGVVEADNSASIRVLGRLGFRPAGLDDMRGRELRPTERLYVFDFAPSALLPAAQDADATSA